MYTSFSKQSWTAFKAHDRPGPIHMLNLIRLRDAAAYADGRSASGAQAYAEYGRISAPVLERIGGRIVWRGAFELLMVGPPEEQWDVCFIAEYPSVGSFVTMMANADYREAMVHRQAGVVDSRLIRLSPQAPGSGFAG